MDALERCLAEIERRSAVMVEAQRFLGSGRVDVPQPEPGDVDLEPDLLSGA